jgi:AmmeMemoRadiSam system protein A
MTENSDKGEILLQIARETICRAVLDASEKEVQSAWGESWLAEPGATFVTLKKRGDLRGCLGTLVAEMPLLDDLRRNARAVVSRDPRFSPLTADELDETTLEVSLLSPLERVVCANEEEALAAIAGERCGWLLECGSRSGTFLPQVWESLQTPEDFWRHLREKANLAAEPWGPGMRLSRYRVSKWTSPEPIG